MNKIHIDTLEKIIDVDGDCLKDDICRVCPFAKKCLPSFLRKKPMPRKQRVETALDLLARMELFDDEELSHDENQ